MTDYQTLRRRHVASMFSMLGPMIDAIDLPADRIAELRNERLEGIVTHARERSAWHRSRLNPGAVDLASIPPMTKQDAVERWDDISTDPALRSVEAAGQVAGDGIDGYLLGRYHVVASGGSTGRRIVVPWDWEGWAATYAAAARWGIRARRRAGAGGREPVVSAVVGAPHGSHFSAALTTTFAARSTKSAHFSVVQPMSEIVGGLNACRPTDLTGYGSVLGLLASEALDGRLRISPKRLYSVSEPLGSQTRELVARAWEAKVVNVYAAVEAGMIAVDCGEGPGMHVNEDVVFLEPVRADGSPAPADEISAKIYVTNLVNRAFPFLRYEISDQVRLVPGPCACGSSFAKIDDVLGRDEEHFRYGDTIVMWYVFATPLARKTAVTAYQVRQTESGADVDVVMRVPFDLQALARELEDELRSVGVAGPRVRVRATEALPRSDTGKQRRYVPIPPPAGPPCP